MLDHARIALGAAAERFRAGDFAGAEAALGPARAERAPEDARIEALSLAALCADRLGRREDAVVLQRETLARIEAHPEWNVFERIAALAREGLERSLAGREPALSYYVLRLPY